ncbi:MAG TPA: AAA family ATPase [Firmicutes bacterium]|nr:AAA family ATPase [Bacillota bacterium]
MWIESLHVDGFGILHDLTLDGLPNGLILFLGENESGKTTLMEFIRSLLFGLPRPGNGYPPLRGGRYGGRMRVIMQDGRRFLIERDGRQATLCEEGSAPERGEPSRRLVPGFDRETYRRIFAVGLQDLQGLSILTEEGVRGRLFSASAGLGSASLAEAMRWLDGHMGNLVSQRTSKRHLNQVLAELDRLENEYQQIRGRSGEYARLQAELARVEAEIANAKAQHEDLTVRLSFRREALALLRVRLPERDRLRTQMEEKVRADRDVVERLGLLREEENERPRTLPVWVPLLVLAGTLLAGLAVVGRGTHLVVLALLGGGLLAAYLFRLRALQGEAERARLRRIKGEEQRLTRMRADLGQEMVILRHQLAAAEIEIARLANRAGVDLPVTMTSLENVAREVEVGLLEERESLEGKRQEVWERLGIAQRQAGELRKALKDLATERRMGELLLHKKGLEEEADRSVRQWAVYAVCRALLDQARETYEQQRQPRVIREAEAFLKSMTGGGYRLLMPLDGDSLQLEEVMGLGRKGEKTWSRGLAEQVYLAVRLGLAREFGRQAEPLPVVLDDVLVDFDPARQAAAARVILDFARQQQVFFLSCHPEQLERFQQVIKDTGVDPASVPRYQVAGGTVRLSAW